ncbi:MAG TPA: phosphoribosylanthranilate isomerase [Pyrinomonadaceae bacterium]|nr:phosphoribosylanthranilate isomerase [Pyrinomonadaceae bacterium]
MTLIKICGVTNLEDALTAVEAGADALGFNFYRRSARFIEPENARRIVSELPENILSVGVFVNEERPEDVERIAIETGIKAVQLHGDESPDYCRKLKTFFVIKALRVTEDFAPECVSEYDVDAILLDAFDKSARGGTGKRFDWAVAERVRKVARKLFLAGGLSPETVAEAIEQVEPYGVDACSSLEISAGRKDNERVRAFITAARSSLRE